MGIIRIQIEHQRMRAALQELAQCNLTTENCASLEAASARVRAIARRGLAPHPKPQCTCPSYYDKEGASLWEWCPTHGIKRP